MIITSLLDTDLYKLTMMQCVLHQFPQAQVSYRFRCRNEGVDLRPCLPRIREEIASLCQLRFTDEELSYLSSLRFIKSDFIDFLGLFHLKEKYVDARCGEARNGGLEIEVSGPWLHTIMFEIPILAIINEVYFSQREPEPDLEEGLRRLRQKIDLLRREPDNSLLRVSDFGTRRRFSRQWQERVIQILKSELGGPIFSGTSNVDLARRYGLVSIGTMGHEYLQACQALGPRLRDSQVYGFEMWAREYRGDLGIALSDVYGIEPFLQDFDMYFCKLFDGARHDSGDPFLWGERMIEHYRRNKCDPRGKTLIFSDGLTVPLILRLYRQFNHRVGIAFGIGTNLMNDLGPEPLNIVMKMVRANGQPVAKISDSPDKGMCDDPTYLAYLRQVFGLREGKDRTPVP